MTGDDNPLLDRRDVVAAQAGDEAAYQRLVERYARRVHDLARRMLRDPHEAEDVAQQAFWNAWRALDRFETDRPFRNWLLRITSNLCRNRLAARARRPALRPRGGEDPLPDVVAGPPAGAGATAAAAGRMRLDRAIEALPERYRLPIVLHYIHDLPLAAIAEITGIGVATVKTHLHRGRAALKALLAEDETPGPARGTTE
jgi:RNA polymerase sigma-70 factor (ECF subfamily)